MATKRLKFTSKTLGENRERHFSPSKTDLNESSINPKPQSVLESAISKYDRSKPKFISDLHKNSKKSNSRSCEKIKGVNLRGVKNFKLTGTFSIYNYEENRGDNYLKNNTFENNKGDGEGRSYAFNSDLGRNVSPNYENSKSPNPEKSRFHLKNFEKNFRKKSKNKGPKLDIIDHDPIPFESSLTLKTPLISSRYKNQDLYKLKTSNLEESRRKNKFYEKLKQEQKKLQDQLNHIKAF